MRLFYVQDDRCAYFIVEVNMTKKLVIPSQTDKYRVSNFVLRLTIVKLKKGSENIANEFLQNLKNRLDDIEYQNYLHRQNLDEKTESELKSSKYARDFSKHPEVARYEDALNSYYENKKNSKINSGKHYFVYQLYEQNRLNKDSNEFDRAVYEKILGSSKKSKNVKELSNDEFIKNIAYHDYHKQHSLQKRLFTSIIIGPYDVAIITIANRLFERRDLRYLFPTEYIHEKVTGKINFAGYRITKENDNTKDNHSSYFPGFRDKIKNIIFLADNNSGYTNRCFNISFIKKNRFGGLREEFEYASRIDKENVCLAFHSLSSRELVVIHNNPWNEPIEGLCKGDKEETFFEYRLPCISCGDKTKVTEIMNLKEPPTKTKALIQLGIKEGHHGYVKKMLQEDIKGKTYKCDFVRYYSSYNCLVIIDKLLDWKQYVDLIKILKNEKYADSIFSVVPRIAFEQNESDKKPKKKESADDVKSFELDKGPIKEALDNDVLKDRLPLLRLANIIDTAAMSQGVEHRREHFKDVLATLNDFINKHNFEKDDFNKLMRNQDKALDDACCFFEEAMLETLSGTFISVKEIEVHSQTDFTGGLGGINVIKESIRAIPDYIMKQTKFFGRNLPSYIFLVRRAQNYFSYYHRIGFSVPTSALLNMYHLSRLFHEVGHLVIDGARQQPAIQGLEIVTTDDMLIFNPKDIREVFCELVSFIIGFKTSILLFTVSKAMSIATYMLKTVESTESRLLIEREIFKYFVCILYYRRAKEFANSHFEPSYKTALEDYELYVKKGFQTEIERVLNDKIQRVEKLREKSITQNDLLKKHLRNIPYRLSELQNTICLNALNYIKYFQSNTLLDVKINDWLEAERDTYKQRVFKGGEENSGKDFKDCSDDINEENEDYTSYLNKYMKTGKLDKAFNRICKHTDYLAIKLDKGELDMNVINMPNEIILALLWAHYMNAAAIHDERWKDNMPSQAISKASRLKGLRRNITAIYEFRKYVEAYSGKQQYD